MGTPAPACRLALNEATLLWPSRSRASDGLCGDARHAARQSDHNPNKDGWCTAFDLTHDPGNGCDAHALVRQLVKARDPRVKYVISQGQICSRSTGWRWKVYPGANQHNKHAHVSILPSAIHDIAPWWGQQPTPTVPPPVYDVEDATMKATYMEIGPLGEDGKGWTLWDPGLGRDPIAPDASVRANAPAADGYSLKTPWVAAQARDGKVLVEVQGGPPGGKVPVFIRAW